MHLSFVNKDRSGTYCLPPDPWPQGRPGSILLPAGPEQKVELHPIHPASAVLWGTPPSPRSWATGSDLLLSQQFSPVSGSYLLYNLSEVPEQYWHRIWLL